MSDQDFKKSETDDRSKNKNTGLIRVDEELLDRVRLQAFKNKISIKDYVEHLILKENNEINEYRNSKDSENETTDQDLNYKTIKIEIEGHLYIEE